MIKLGPMVLPLLPDALHPGIQRLAEIARTLRGSTTPQDEIVTPLPPGFLQVGPQPPAADWELMVRENSGGIVLNPWAVLAPSIAIGLLAMTVNLAAAALVPATGRKAVPAL